MIKLPLTLITGISVFCIFAFGITYWKKVPDTYYYDVQVKNLDTLHIGFLPLDDSLLFQPGQDAILRTKIGAQMYWDVIAPNMLITKDTVITIDGIEYLYTIGRILKKGKENNGMGM